MSFALGTQPTTEVDGGRGPPLSRYFSFLVRSSSLTTQKPPILIQSLRHFSEIGSGPPCKEHRDPRRRSPPAAGARGCHSRWGRSRQRRLTEGTDHHGGTETRRSGGSPAYGR